MRGRDREATHPLLSIVDDDVSFRTSLCGLIRAFGFRVAAFQSGQEFLDSHHVADTACLILDVQMAGMSGLELQWCLAKSHRRIPIVFITGYVGDDEERRALQAGAVAVLHKPLDEQMFLQSIQAALSRGVNEA